MLMQKNGRYVTDNVEIFVSQDTTGKTKKENPRFTEIQIGKKFNFSDKCISGVAAGQINSTSKDVVVGSQLKY